VTKKVIHRLKSLGFGFRLRPQTISCAGSLALTGTDLGGCVFHSQRGLVDCLHDRRFADPFVNYREAAVTPIFSNGTPSVVSQAAHLLRRPAAAKKLKALVTKLAKSGFQSHQVRARFTRAGKSS
jgi:hypothetical protein